MVKHDGNAVGSQQPQKPAERKVAKHRRHSGSSINMGSHKPYS
jgi:hypothetical protein